jgi:Concanavalin A-like lectin/glucanases superfamily
MVAVVSSWQGTLASLTGYFIPHPAAQSVDVPVASTGAGGNWLLAICSWRIAPGIATTVAVGDDAHNRWEPLGPAGTTSPSGVTRCSVWAAPNARAAGNVFVSPTGYTQAMAVQVVEVSGLPPWLSPAGIVTQFANAATSLPSMSPAPGSSALILTACASDNNSDTITLAAGGWTALSTLPVSNGADHTSDLTLTTAYQVASGATASFSSSGSQDLSGLTAAVLIAPAAPVAPSQRWPYVQFQAGFGSGASTPWDQIAWTDLTARFQGLSGARGKQYELDVIQAGSGTWTLSNNDGALTPGYSPSPYYPGVLVYTPVRLLATWPPPPAASARTYVVTRGFMERWPQALTSSRYQVSNAVSTDMWALLTPLQLTLPRAEVRQDNPYGYWTCGDPAGSAAAASLSGPAGSLQVVPSRYGVASAVQAFGASASYLAGDPGCTTWQQSSVPGADTQGYSLYYQDTALPAISAGVTIEGWFNLLASQPTGINLALITVSQPKGILAQVYVAQSTGHMLIDVFDKITGAKTTTTLSSNNWLGANWVHVALEITQTTWHVYVNAGSFGSVSGSCNFASSPYWMSFNGTSDRLGAGQFWNGQVAGLAVTGQLLTQPRVISHYISELIAMEGEDSPGPRMERLLAAGNCAFPRCIPSNGYALQGAVDIAGQAVSQNVTNVAESDNGTLMVDGPGYLFYLSRLNGYNLPVSWTFGEVPSAPLNANPYFEAGVSPWAGQNGAALSQSSLWSYQGQFAALFTGNGATANPQISCEDIAVTPGTSLTVTSWVYSPQGYAAGLLGIILWKDSGHSPLSSSASPAVPLSAAVENAVTASGRAPAGAAFACFIIQAAGTPANTVQFLADVSVLATTYTEYSYLPDIAFDYDPSQVFNDLTLTQLSAPPGIGSAATGITITALGGASVAQYGDQTLQQTIYTQSPQAITDLGQWILNTMGSPQVRVAQMTLYPAANPALWPVVLGAESGQVAQVLRRLGGTQLEISGQFQVMNVQHAIGPGQWRTTLSLVPYYGQILTCDDPIRGTLDGLNRIGW